MVRSAAATSLSNVDLTIAYIVEAPLKKALRDSSTAVREQAAKTIGTGDTISCSPSNSLAGILGSALYSREIVQSLMVLLRDEFYQVSLLQERRTID